jgi:hypothetical protein
VEATVHSKSLISLTAEKKGALTKADHEDLTLGQHLINHLINPTNLTGREPIHPNLQEDRMAINVRVLHLRDQLADRTEREMTHPNLQEDRMAINVQVLHLRDRLADRTEREMIHPNRQEDLMAKEVLVRHQKVRLADHTEKEIHQNQQEDHTVINVQVPLPRDLRANHTENEMIHPDRQEVRLATGVPGRQRVLHAGLTGKETNHQDQPADLPVERDMALRQKDHLADLIQDQQDHSKNSISLTGKKTIRPDLQKDHHDHHLVINDTVLLRKEHLVHLADRIQSHRNSTGQEADVQTLIHPRKKAVKHVRLGNTTDLKENAAHLLNRHVSPSGRNLMIRAALLIRENHPAMTVQEENVKKTIHQNSPIK